MDVADWVRALGLVRTLRGSGICKNGVSAEDLCHFTRRRSRGLGVTATGHRRRLLVAIAALRSEGPSPAARIDDVDLDPVPD